MTTLRYTLTWPLALCLFFIFNQPLKAQISNQSLTPTDSALCIGDSTTIVTGGSDAGVSYYLRNNADSSIVAGPIIGTGSALTFNTGSLSSTTSFHVYAEQTSSAMDFDGVDDIVNTSSLVQWDDTSTLMAWYKSADASSGAIFTWGSPQVNNYAVLEFRYVNPSFNYIRFYKPQSTFPSVLPHPNNPTDWHHVAIVKEGMTTQLYLDGVLTSTGFVPAPTNPTQTSLGAGLFNGSIQLHYDGLIDELSHWDTVLTPAQINQYMNAPLAGTEPNLDLYYSFESVNGTTLPDLSPSGNNGQMMNMAANPLVPGVFPGDSAYMNQIITIQVDSIPNVTAGANQTVCFGDSVTLNGGGATTYTWDNNVINGVPFVPSVTTTYTVTGSNIGNCSATAQVTVTVDSLPNVTAGSPQAICPGDSVTLTGAGAMSYTWDNNVMDGVPFAPMATTTYTVTGTGANNCSATAQVTVTVNPLPSVSAGPDMDVCFGDSVTLMGSGASSYVWDNNVMDGIPFLPQVNTTFAVTGTDSNGCVATDSVAIQVIMVDASLSISGGTLTANAVNATYQWLECDSGMAGMPIAGATNASFSPTTSGNYAVAVTQMGCTDTSVCENVVVVGLAPNPGKLQIRVYPNPNNGRFRIQIQGLQTLEANIQVIDMQGKVIFHTEMEQEKEIDLRGVMAGIYFVKVQAGQFANFQRIVVH